MPQQAAHTKTIFAFLAAFAELPHHHHHHHLHGASAPAAAGFNRTVKPHRGKPSQKVYKGPHHATAAAVDGGVATAGADEGHAESSAQRQLHREGLRGTTQKGPAHPHHLLRFDSQGIAHQHMVPQGLKRGVKNAVLGEGVDSRVVAKGDGGNGRSPERQQKWQQQERQQQLLPQQQQEQRQQKAQQQQQQQQQASKGSSLPKPATTTTAAAGEGEDGTIASRTAAVAPAGGAGSGPQQQQQQQQWEQREQQQQRGHQQLHQQQQQTHQQQHASKELPLLTPALTAGAAKGERGTVALRGAAAAAAGGGAGDFGAATDEQLEEMEALQAIFMDEYCQISTDPPKFSIKLRSPGTDDVEVADGAVHGLPSQLFTLKFTLPRNYPAEGGKPAVEVVGPLGGNDPLRHALLGYCTEQVREQREQMGGAGYIYPLVECLREWIDGNIPADVGQRKGGTTAAVAVAGGGIGIVVGGGGGSSTAAFGAAAATDGAGGGDGVVPWWEKEEADQELIQRAIREAAAASWGSWAEEGAAADAEESHGTTSSSSSSSSGAAAAAVAGVDALHDGDGSRGRWDYVIGLVGKPSAGKSTFFNAVTGAFEGSTLEKIRKHKTGHKSGKPHLLSITSRLFLDLHMHFLSVLQVVHDALQVLASHVFCTACFAARYVKLSLLQPSAPHLLLPSACLPVSNLWFMLLLVKVDTHRFFT